MAVPPPQLPPPASGYNSPFVVSSKSASGATSVAQLAENCRENLNVCVDVARVDNRSDGLWLRQDVGGGTWGRQKEFWDGTR